MASRYNYLDVKGAAMEEAEEAKQPFLLCLAQSWSMASCPLRTLNQLWFEPAF